MLKVKLNIRITNGQSYPVLECEKCYNDIYEDNTRTIPKFCPNCGTKLWSIE